MHQDTDQASELRNATGEQTAAERLPAGLRCIGIGSGKGGVGKTMISVGLACCLARRDYRVLLVDADLGLANVDLQMGVDPVYTLQDVVYGDCSLAQAVVHARRGLDLILSSSGAKEMVELGNARRELLVGDLVRFAGQYDYLLIDVGAGIGGTVTGFLAAAPEVLTVVANEPTSVMDAYSLVKVLLAEKTPPSIMLVLNMVRSLDEGERLGQRINAITRKFLGTEFPVAGIVPYHATVTDAIRRRSPVVDHAPDSAPARCLEELAGFVAAGGGRSRRPGLRASFFDRLLGVDASLRRAGKEPAA